MVLALAGVAQWIECWPVKPKGHRFISQSRAYAWVAGQLPTRERTRGNHTLMFLSFSLPLSLKIKKYKKIVKGSRPGAPHWMNR